MWVFFVEKKANTLYNNHKLSQTNLEKRKKEGQSGPSVEVRKDVKND